MAHDPEDEPLIDLDRAFANPHVCERRGGRAPLKELG